jgi:hypothetical protein
LFIVARTIEQVEYAQLVAISSLYQREQSLASGEKLVVHKRDQIDHTVERYLQEHYVGA